MTTKRTTRRAGMTGQIDAQGRSHDAADCGAYRLVRRVAPNTWEVMWTASCDDDAGTIGRLRFVSRDEYSRYF